MDTTNLFSLSFVAIGALVGIIIGVIIIKLSHKNGVSKTEYDERQQLVRGTGYKLGFWTMAIYEIVLQCLDIAGVSIPVVPAVLHFGAVFVGLLAACTYNIWHNAYFGLNTRGKRYKVLLFMIALMNVVPLIRHIPDGTLIENGVIGLDGVNVLCAIMLIIVSVELAIKSAVDSKAGKDEGEAK